eukprot:CAMPEP_0181064940 /NCGR_PEP_ID=MMETSP1070-20121207/24468_1 /TAXON_ID=265543 /ORGANISM="Minutocellus polymorphus, Strain NH13" /LENGTH=615 /DNA_ID=CAMNT_0023145287 /DNA_START=178 /DNA_END=2025 /DNA_ORIENTATION=-
MIRRQSQQDATSAAIEQLRFKAAAGKSKHPSRSLLNNASSSSHIFTRKDLELASRRRRVGGSLAGLTSRSTARKDVASPSGTSSPSSLRRASLSKTHGVTNHHKTKSTKGASPGATPAVSLEKEAVALDNMIAGNNPEAQRISSLTDEIDEANAGADEKLHYRLQLNHMLQRCRKNSVSLDKHMGAMSDTLAAARKEQEQCERMLGEVEAGFSDAVRSLESTVRTLEIEQDERNRTLADKRSDAKNSSMLESWRNERETSRQDLENSLGGNLRQEKEDLKEQMRQRQRDIKMLNKEVGTKVSDVSALEEIATKIKQATGLNDLEEVIEKLQHAKNHHEKLLSERNDAEERLRAARHMLQDANASSEHNTARGYGDTELNRYLQDELSQSINNEQMQGKVVRSTNVRLEAVLVGLRQGSMGLYQKLLPFHPTLLDCDPPKLSDTTSSSPIQAAYETLEILKIAALILGKMLDAVGGIDRVMESEASVGDSTPTDVTAVAEAGNRESATCKSDVDEYSNPNSSARENCRVEANVNRSDSPSLHRDDGGGCDERKSDSGYPPRCPSRGTMKAMSESEIVESPTSPGTVRTRPVRNLPARDREDPLKRVDDVCRDPLLE